MLKAINRIILLAILSVAYCTYVPAQNEISSPYSKYGYGLPSNVTSGAYDAMGKVGYAVQHPHLINFKNPASYVAFDSLSFIADAAFSIYSSTLKTADVSNSFASNKGKLPWPVSACAKTADFGNHPHPDAPNVTVHNYGIELLTHANADVKSVFKGTVSTVRNFEGSYFVIIRHGEYRCSSAH